MSWRLKVNERVPHRRLPDWCLEIIAEVKGAWAGVPTALPESAIGVIGSMIGTMRFCGIKADQFNGTRVPRKESGDGRSLTIYSRTGKTALVEFRFEEEK